MIRSINETDEWYKNLKVQSLNLLFLAPIDKNLPNEEMKTHFCEQKRERIKDASIKNIYVLLCMSNAAWV